MTRARWGIGEMRAPDTPHLRQPDTDTQAPEGARSACKLWRRLPTLDTTPLGSSHHFELRDAGAMG
jgi:hypothetical protein